MILKIYYKTENVKLILLILKIKITNSFEKEMAKKIYSRKYMSRAKINIEKKNKQRKKDRAKIKIRKLAPSFE